MNPRWWVIWCARWPEPALEGETQAVFLHLRMIWAVYRKVREMLQGDVMGRGEVFKIWGFSQWYCDVHEIAKRRNLPSKISSVRAIAECLILSLAYPRRISWTDMMFQSTKGGVHEDTRGLILIDLRALWIKVDSCTRVNRSWHQDWTLVSCASL